MKSINPFNQQVLQQYDEFSDSELRTKVDASAKMYVAWKAKSLSYRILLVKKLAENLRSKKIELAASMTLEMGKIHKEAIGEIEKCAWLCDYYAENAPQLLAGRHVKTEMYKSYVT
ncbi:MAG TPA: aldehyde dehydrogenase family protein, partial [Saprospiraceae bacterium]|nr:aldehyde dehydrogenase family protein [Saprospiraceae bacterium]